MNQPIQPGVAEPASARVRQPRIERLALDGVLLFDKPLGWSSNDAVQRVRRLLRAQKTGHTGTLDPMATGLLPLLLGEATKFSADLLDADKTYLARVRLGACTNTGDLEGEIIRVSETKDFLSLDEATLHQVLQGFQGEQQQVPPMYSALKRDGKPLYEYARAGIELDRSARTIHIAAIRLCEGLRPVTNADGLELAEFDIEVTCSKGTYIRVLAEDIGRRLGSGAHLSALRRTAVGGLQLSAALSIEALTDFSQQPGWAPQTVLAPVDALLSALPAVLLDEPMAQRFSQGQRLPMGARPEQGRVRVYRSSPLGLLGTGFLNNDGAGHSLLSPQRLIREQHDPRT